MLTGAQGLPGVFPFPEPLLLLQCLPYGEYRHPTTVEQLSKPSSEWGNYGALLNSISMEDGFKGHLAGRRYHVSTRLSGLWAGAAF